MGRVGDTDEGGGEGLTYILVSWRVIYSNPHLLSTFVKQLILVKHD